MGGKDVPAMPTQTIETGVAEAMVALWFYGVEVSLEINL